MALECERGDAVAEVRTDEHAGEDRLRRVVLAADACVAIPNAAADATPPPAPTRIVASTTYAQTLVLVPSTKSARPATVTTEPAMPVFPGDALPRHERRSELIPSCGCNDGACTDKRIDGDAALPQEQDGTGSETMPT